MKKSLVYLVAVLLLASMLSGCGSDRVNNDGGTVTVSPTAVPTVVPTAQPSASPDVSPSASPELSGETDAVGDGGATAGDAGTADGGVTDIPASTAGSGS